MNAVDIVPLLQTGPFWLWFLIGGSVIGIIGFVFMLWRMPFNPLQKRMPTLSRAWLMSMTLICSIAMMTVMQLAYRSYGARLVKAREIADVMQSIDRPGCTMRFVRNEWYSSLCTIGIYDAAGVLIARTELFKDEREAIARAIAEQRLSFRDPMRQQILMSYQKPMSGDIHAIPTH